MADLLVTLSALLLAAAPQAADRCADGACVASPASLDLSAMHGSGGSSAPASSLDVESWSWGASNSGQAREAASGMASGKRAHKPVGKASYSDISMTRAPAASSSSSPSSSASVSSVSSLAGGPSGAAAASYARLAPPVCSSSSACPGTVSVQLARKGWDGCVRGSHIPSAHLRGTSSSFHLTDVTVEDCDDASGRMTLRYASVSEAPSKPSTR